MNAEESSTRGRLLGVACLLALFAFVLYASAGRFEFLNYDDPDYVTANPVVAQGLHAEGVRWAFGFQASNWHPLTWLSHMLDVELFGLEPGPMHMVNVGLHALNAALLFLALAALSRAFWPSLVVAALFAAHPLRVQCVAWISERKELLASAFFFGLLLAYGRYVRRRAWGAYLLVVLLLALGCMAKPMLVTAPFVLVLLDLWPLARLGPGRGADAPPTARVLLEKVPLLAIAAGSCILTMLAQRAGGAVGELEALTLSERLWTAGGGVLAYLRATLLPTGLAAFYPHPALTGQPLVVPGAIGLGLAVLGSALAFLWRRSAPALFTGWFWFLGMLVPVLGLVQVGDQAWADRYAYLPTIGLYVACVFGVRGCLRERSEWLTGATVAGLSAAVALAWVTTRTLPHWQDSRVLFERALAVTETNWIAHNNVGLVYLERREVQRAREHFEAAIAAHPGFISAHYNLGLSLEANGDFQQAAQNYLDTLKVRPGHAETLVRLAALARVDGRSDMAEEFFDQAIAANPTNAHVWTAYAMQLLEMGEVDRAGNVAESAMRLDSSLPEAHLVLAEIALRRGEFEESDQRLQRAAALAPDSAETHALRARWHMQRGNHDLARSEFDRSISLDPSNARARHDLGALLINLGEVDAADQQFKALNDIRPDDPQALLGLSIVAVLRDNPGEAVRLLERALQQRPNYPLVLINLAAAHEKLRNWRRALEYYDQSFENGVPDPGAACAAAWILATGPDVQLLDGERAVQLATYAAQRQANNALQVLAAAHARNGNFEQAVVAQEQAIKMAATPEQKRELEARLPLYRDGKPYTRTK